MLAQIIRIASGRRSKTLLRGRPKDLRFTRSEPDHWALINHARASRDLADIDCLPRLLRSAPTSANPPADMYSNTMQCNYRRVLDKPYS